MARKNENLKLPDSPEKQALLLKEIFDKIYADHRRLFEILARY